jgi:hypothetical protein
MPQRSGRCRPPRCVLLADLRYEFSRREIGEARMQAHLIVMAAPALDHHLHPGPRAEPLRLRHSSRNLPMKRSVAPFCQGFPGSINAVLMP